MKPNSVTLADLELSVRAANVLEVALVGLKHCNWHESDAVRIDDAKHALWVAGGFAYLLKNVKGCGKRSAREVCQALNLAYELPVSVEIARLVNEMKEHNRMFREGLDMLFQTLAELKGRK